MANTFDRHDFSFKWSHGEMEAARDLFQWGLDQVEDAYKGISKLAGTAGNPNLTIYKGSATNIAGVANESIEAVIVDPPYHDNVMYAECSDFFYVWMKRSLGSVFPEIFNEDLRTTRPWLTLPVSPTWGVRKGLWPLKTTNGKWPLPLVRCIVSSKEMAS
jgi:adenine-specific DNA methylase